jgi:hypothetical protein
MTLTFAPLGGCLFRVILDDAHLGTIETGELSDDGQWIETDDLEDAAREAFPQIPETVDVLYPF